MHLLRRILWIAVSVGLYRLLVDFLLLDIYQVYVLPFFLILIFGLPHGATDHMLSNFIAKREVSGKITLSFITTYLSIISVYGLVWYLSPEIGLAIFLLLSAYHFGETQWIRDTAVTDREYMKRIHNFMWGVTLLSALFIIHATQTLSFLQGLIDNQVAVKSLSILKFWILPAAVLLTVFFSFVLYRRSAILSQFFELIAFIVLFWTTELIFAFSIFFAVFHSRDTIIAMIRKIGSGSADGLSWIRFYQYASPFTILSIAGIFIIMLVMKKLQADIHQITMFFVLISLVTAPHMWVIERFYGSSK